LSTVYLRLGATGKHSGGKAELEFHQGQAFELTLGTIRKDNPYGCGENRGERGSQNQ